MDSLIIPTVTVTTNVCPSTLTIKDKIQLYLYSIIDNERQQTSSLAGNL